MARAAARGWFTCFLPELPCIVFILLYTKREADTVSPAGKEFLRKAAAELKAQQHLLP